MSVCLGLCDGLGCCIDAHCLVDVPNSSRALQCLQLVSTVQARGGGPEGTRPLVQLTNPEHSLSACLQGPAHCRPREPPARVKRRAGECAGVMPDAAHQPVPELDLNVQLRPLGSIHLISSTARRPRDSVGSVTQLRRGPHSPRVSVDVRVPTLHTATHTLCPLSPDNSSPSGTHLWVDFYLLSSQNPDK